MDTKMDEKLLQVVIVKKESTLTSRINYISVLLVVIGVCGWYEKKSWNVFLQATGSKKHFYY